MWEKFKTWIRSVAWSLRGATPGRAVGARVPGEVDAAVEWAQSATVDEDWPEAVQRWSEVLQGFRGSAPPKAYARLAIAYREQGELDRAEGVLRSGLSTFPDDAGLAMEWALFAMVREEWSEATDRWAHVFERFGPELPPKAFARFAISYRERGKLDVASAVLERARLRYPDDVDLAIEWAQLAMVRRDWSEAVERWEWVRRRFDDDAPPKVYAWLAIALREQGEFGAAFDVIGEGLSLFGEDVVLESEAAQLAMERQDWEESFRRWEDVIGRFSSGIPAKAFARLALAYRRQGRVAEARSAAERGLSRFPESRRLVAARAEVAMIQRDWAEAIGRWHELLDLWSEDDDFDEDRARFPRRGGADDWYELAWRTIVFEWDRITPSLEVHPSAEFYRAMGRTLRRADLPSEARRLLHGGLAEYPSEPGLAFDYVESSLLREFGRVSRGDLESLTRDVEGVPQVWSTVVSLARLVSHQSRNGSPGQDEGSAVRDRETDFRETERLLGRFADARSAGLASVHLVRVPRGSSIELHVKSQRFLDRGLIEQHLRELSDEGSWEELFASDNLLLQQARRVADEFGERYEDLPFLRGEALSDAVLLFVFHELCLFEPMKRLAESIAATDDGAPVFIEVRTTSFQYLDGYTYSRFDLIYLYFELRRRGVNAFLCLFESAPDYADLTDTDGSVTHTSTRLSFRPSARTMQPKGTVVGADRVSYEEAIVPAGLRSVERVVSKVGPSLMFASGSVVKQFAYDRSIQQDFPVQPQVSTHPPQYSMPTFHVDLWPTTTLEGLQLNGERAVGTVEVSAEVGGDWLEWLDRSLHGYLKEMSIHSVAQVSGRRITRVHTCDHLFPESTFLADAVKRAGGENVLWPHSANPVHVDLRRGDSFDEVHAVTRAGCAEWHKRFPDKKVTHSPTLMLDPPQREFRFDEDEPLSVIVLGGRSVLGYMPVVDRRQHVASHADLFRGLEEIQARHRLDVYFKPRGLTGEHEMWLFEAVGRTANWERILEHPMRLRRPNPLFVSISTGTSALLEGLSRGIPGMIVRDFPVRDYTTIDSEAFPTVTTEHALEVVEKCCTREGYEDILNRELTYYLDELTP